MLTTGGQLAQAGVVDQNVHPSPGIHGPSHHVVHLSRVPDVAHHAESLDSPFSSHVFGKLLRPSLRTITHGHPRPFTGKPSRRGPSDSGTGRGCYYRHLVVESHTAPRRRLRDASTATPPCQSLSRLPSYWHSGDRRVVKAEEPLAPAHEPPYCGPFSAIMSRVLFASAASGRRASPDPRASLSRYASSVPLPQ